VKVLMSWPMCKGMVDTAKNGEYLKAGTEMVNCTATMPECCVPLQYLGRQGPCHHKDGYWNFTGNEDAALSACSNMAGETLAYINMLRKFAKYAEETGQSGYAIMLEDDARIISPDFAGDLEYVLREQKGWDLLKLHGGGTPAEYVPKGAALERLDKVYEELKKGSEENKQAGFGLGATDPNAGDQVDALSAAGMIAHLGDVAMMVHSSNALKVVDALFNSGPNIFPAGLDWNLVGTQMVTGIKVVDSIKCLMYPSYWMDESSTIGATGGTQSEPMTATPPTSKYYPQSTCILNGTKMDFVRR